MRRILIAITGASGSQISYDLLKILNSIEGLEIHLVISDAGKWIIEHEMDVSVSTFDTLVDARYDNHEIWQLPASGTSLFQEMIICPCSMNTLAKITHGLCDNLICRAASVILKEKRNLIIVPRETPLDTIQLYNLAYLSNMGAHIIPPMLTFYQKPKTINELVNQFVMKILDAMNINIQNGLRWSDILEKVPNGRHLTNNYD